MANKTQKVTIDIKAETTKATNEIKRLNGEVSRLGKHNASLKQTTAQVNQMSRSFASLTKHVSQLAIIYGTFQGLQTTVRTFAEFEASMTKLGVISGATTSELEAMQQVAENLGSTTVFTASQVADGMNAMAMAGLSADEAMSAINGTLDISAIGLISVEEASLIATRAMNGFSLEAEDMGRIADVIAKGATDSATSVTQLGNAYEKVASVATTFGVSLEETTALLGVLADAGRVGSEAGTQLKITMSRLAGNKEAKKYLDELGVSIYDSAGAILPFNVQMRNLKTELDKLSEAERNIKMAEIFGSEALASANIFLNSLDEIESKTNELKDSFGFASKSAKAMMDNLTGDWKEFNSALEGLILNLGEGLSPALRDILDEATEFIQTLDPEEVKDFGKGVGELAHMLKDAVDAVISIVGAVKGFSETLTQITGISGSTQVKLLLLAGALSKFKVVALGMESVLGGFILKQTKLTALFGASIVKIPLMTRAIIRLKVAFRALTATMALNPFVLVTTAIVGIGTAILYTRKETREWQASLNEMGDSLETANDVLSVTEKALMDTGKSGREAFGGLVRDLIDDTKTSIEDLTEKIEEEKNSWFVNSKEVARMETLLAEHIKTKDALIAKEKLLVKVNKKIQEAVDKATKAQIKQADGNKKAKDASKKLIKSRQKELEQLEKNNKTRLAQADKTLISLYEKEKGLVDNLIKLEKELAGIRKKYANERIVANQTIDDIIANARVSGLNDYQKYLDAQKRADEALALSKKYLAEGNLELAQKYADDYRTLYTQLASDEISIKKEVSKWDAEKKKFVLKEEDEIKRTRKENFNELKKDAEADRVQTLAIIEAKKKAELSAHNLKISNKINELELAKLSILSQIEYIKNLEKIQTLTSGLDPKDPLTFESSMAQIDKINSMIDNLTTQKRQAKLDLLADRSQADKTLESYEKDVEGNPVKKTIELDSKKAEKAEDKFDKNAEKGEITKFLTLNLSDAEKNLKALQEEAETDTSAEHELELAEAYGALSKLQEMAGETTKSKHNLDTSIALRANAKMRNALSKPSYSTHYVKTVYLKSSGGEIPKFANGGHARRTGALGGFGGGDKIKALLEAGEFIIRKEAVKALGLARLYQINQGKLPRYQHGGQVGTPALPRYAIGGVVTSTTSDKKTVNVNLNVGGQTYAMISEEHVANSLANYLERSTF